VSDPDQTPAEGQVRRLLADARHEGPIPTDVADRLDGVLAELQGESRRTPAPVDLAARRRRRVVRNGLVAAAAVVVLGVAVSQVDLSEQRGDSGSADSGAASSAQESARDDEPGADAPLAAGRPLVLSSEHFDREVNRLRAVQEPAAGASVPNDLDSAASELQDGFGAPTSRSWCDDPSWGSGQRIAVRYDGKRGVLVLRPPADGSRVADLYLCGGTAPARSTTVPAG
jgi:hypothetical protein